MALGSVPMTPVLTRFGGFAVGEKPAILRDVRHK
jgi:hypothetical protein